MKQLVILLLPLALLLNACGSPDNNTSSKKTSASMSSVRSSSVDAAIIAIRGLYPSMDNVQLMERGVRNAASFWEASDGSDQEFVDFCVAHYQPTAEARLQLFNSIQNALEAFNGNYNRISVELKKVMHEVGQPINPIDEMLGNIDPFCHLSDDMFASKIAFVTLLNFPSYTLDEKNEMGPQWTRLQWAYARLGDVFGSRVPAAVAQNFADKLQMADNYISSYNIVMGQLRNEEGEKLFPDNMSLISHWGLRDQLKSDYADADGRGLEKQRMIYRIMTHIVDQTIPERVVNNDRDTWCPYTNEVKSSEGKVLSNKAENNVRYKMLHSIYEAAVAMDQYCPAYPTYIKRSFHQAMEMTDRQIEDMFVRFITSPEVASTAALIKSRLGRDLEPFDIWYDGFKSRSSISEDDLTALTRRLYPNTEAFAADLPNIMKKLGFSEEKAEWVCLNVEVDASRGAGHAWGAMSKDDISHLRSRCGADGMDYKGYNIGIHEFGHNVEQTISMYDVDNYTMAGVPSTAFTEALAFVFQSRDLELLGFDNDDHNAEALKVLDNFWGCYEIMGVSLVDLYTWRWLYENPKASVEDLKATIIRNAEMVWNKYYAPILGEKDSHILAIYSHSIDIPLYLPNYPYGHLVQSQLEQFFAGKNLGTEVCRMYPAGRLTPDCWMRNAVGAEVSTEPLLEQTRAALKQMAEQ